MDFLAAKAKGEIPFQQLKGSWLGYQIGSKCLGQGYSFLRERVVGSSFLPFSTWVSLGPGQWYIIIRVDKNWAPGSWFL